MFVHTCNLLSFWLLNGSVSYRAQLYKIKQLRFIASGNHPEIDVLLELFVVKLRLTNSFSCTIHHQIHLTLIWKQTKQTTWYNVPSILHLDWLKSLLLYQEIQNLKTTFCHYVDHYHIADPMNEHLNANMICSHI